MRNPTPWANNDVKNPVPWASATKNPDAWANNNVKVPTSFTGVGKSTNSWGINYQAPQTYFYNDANMTYNSPYIEYNYLLNENQLNQRLVSIWSQVV